MKQVKLKQKDLAKVLGLTQGAISHKLLGRRAWSVTDALNIEQFTKGMVSRMDILYPNERK